ncbi:hypothetical protein FRC17_008433, partial [Serendipita sp. 399]
MTASGGGDNLASSTEPGPNAPLSDGCGDSRQPGANGRSGIERWMAAGFPREKIVLGVPAYGVISRSRAERLVHRRRERREEAGHSGGGDILDREADDNQAVKTMDWMKHTGRTFRVPSDDDGDREEEEEDDRKRGDKMENGREEGLEEQEQQ